MYYIFNNEIRSWRNQIVQAKITQEPPTTTPHWWDGKPLQKFLPLLHFSVNLNGPLLDNFFTGTIFNLYSNRLINLLQKSNVKFETFPVELIDRKTNKPSSLDYQIFHLLENHAGLDKKLTKIDAERGEINKLVLTKNCIRKKHPLFRLKSMEDLVLIHQDLKDLLDKEEITGCTYIPVEKYQSGISFYFDNMK